MKATLKSARKTLDERLAVLMANREAVVPPPTGWIKAVRTALGMSTGQLGRRLGVTASAITGLEQSEANGTIQLNTLRRVAGALGVSVVYALVPATSLENMVEERARVIAEADVRRVNRTMVLEDQQTSADVLQQALETHIDRMRESDLWNDDQGS